MHKNFQDLVYRIHNEGHQIGNHSYTHTNLIFKNKEFVQDEILRTKEIIEKVVGEHSKYFRPPYGYFDRTTLMILNKLGLTCVLWDVDSKDYKLNSTIDISNRVIPNTSKGSILLFHDNELTSYKTQTYLPVILNLLNQKEFVFTPLSI